jgi:hypothetical protein
MTVIPPIDPPAVPANYTQQSLTLMVQVRELGRTVDGFAFAPEGRRAEIGTVSSLPEEFLQRTAAALDVNPDFGAAFNLTAAEVRDALNFRREFLNAAHETRLVAKGIEDTVAVRIAPVGEKCLHFYHAAQRANRKNAGASMVPHLAEMTRALNKGRKKKKKAVPPDAVTKGDAK